MIEFVLSRKLGQASGKLAGISSSFSGVLSTYLSPATNRTKPVRLRQVLSTPPASRKNPYRRCARDVAAIPMVPVMSFHCGPWTLTNRRAPRNSPISRLTLLPDHVSSSNRRLRQSNSNTNRDGTFDVAQLVSTTSYISIFPTRRR